jgi:hypothetical protein
MEIRMVIYSSERNWSVDWLMQRWPWLGLASNSERVILLIAGLYYILLEVVEVIYASDNNRIHEMAHNIGERLRIREEAQGAAVSQELCIVNLEDVFDG